MEQLTRNYTYRGVQIDMLTPTDLLEALRRAYGEIERLRGARELEREKELSFANTLTMLRLGRR